MARVSGFETRLTQAAGPVATMGETPIRWGTISRIDPVQIQSSGQWGVRSVIGGVAGGLPGHQVGHGHGRTVATVGITQPADPSLRVGDAVRIEGSGPTARLVRR